MADPGESTVDALKRRFPGRATQIAQMHTFFSVHTRTTSAQTDYRNADVAAAAGGVHDGPRGDRQDGARPSLHARCNAVLCAPPRDDRQALGALIA